MHEGTKNMLDKINKAPEIKTVFKYWYDDNAFKSSFLHALSSLFPGGELYFMKSINHYVKTNPEFKEEAKLFFMQEGNHTKGHRILNREIDNLYNNYVLQDLEKSTDELLKILHNRLTPELNLIVTEALEHVTFNLCETILERQDVLDQAYSDAKELFIYHCEEETGEVHSSIAKKISNKVIKRWYYKLARKLAIRPVTLALLFVLFYYVYLIQKENKDMRFKEILNGLNDLFGLDGWVREGLQNAIKTW